MRSTVLFVALGALLLSAGQPLRAAPDAGKFPMLSVVERTTEPLLKADKPWEDWRIGYCQVLREGKQWHLWYNAYDHDFDSAGPAPAPGSLSYLCYARSEDGVRWEKPDLGLFKYRSGMGNNILAEGIVIGSVFVDDKAPAGERFKAVGVRRVQGRGWGFGGTSSDGVRWEWSERPLFQWNSDTANVCFRDGDVYRLYARVWTAPPFGGTRVVGYSESKAFGDFPEPKVILAPDKDDLKDLHFYSSAATKLKDTLYLMPFSAFTSGDGCVRVHAAYSRDGKTFTRLGREPLVGLGKGFDSKGLYVAPGAVPGEKAGTYWFYYFGTAVSHDENLPKKVKSDGGVGRFLLRVEE